MKKSNKKSNIIIVLFIIFLLISVSFVTIYYNEIFEKEDDQGTNPSKPIKNETITISKDLYFSKPEIKEYRDYFEIEDEDASSFTIVPGQIRVPVYTTVLTFPLGAKIEDFYFNPSDVKTISTSKKATTSLPPQILEYNEMSNTYEDNINPSTFPDYWYKTSTGSGIFDGKPSLYFILHVYPARYSGKENQIYYIEKANFTVSYENITQLNELNFTYDLLIISPLDFKNSLLDFIEHKNRLGIKTINVPVEEIYSSGQSNTKARDNPECIKYFIKNAIEQWGIKYVLLVGDVEKIPVRYIHVGEKLDSPLIKEQISYASVSDLYYADIYNANGSFSSWDPNNNNIFGETNWEGVTEEIDYYPDVYIGRLPCKNSEEVKKVTSKIINYEFNPDNDLYFDKMVLIGGDTFQPWRYLLIGSGLRLRVILSRLLFNTSSVFYKEGEETCNLVENIMNKFDTEKIYSSVILPRENKKPLINYYIRKAINKGAGFVLFSGHGNPTMYATYKIPSIFPIRRRPIRGFSSLDVKLLKNDDKLPVVVFDACSCGKLDGPTCIAWDFVKKEDGGSIATFASTNLSFGYISEYVHEGLNGYMTLKLFEKYDQGSIKAGEMLANAQIEYLNMNSFKHHMDYLIIAIWELFGDPTLQIGGYANLG